MPMRARPLLLLSLLAAVAIAGAIAAAAAAGTTSKPPCAPARSTIGGHRAVAFCGPATVTINVAGRSYRFAHGLCALSRTMDGLELNVGTRVDGVAGNAGRSFVSIV